MDKYHIQSISECSRALESYSYYIELMTYQTDEKLLHNFKYKEFVDYMYMACNGLACFLVYSRSHTYCESPLDVCNFVDESDYHLFNGDGCIKIDNNCIHIPTQCVRFLRTIKDELSKAPLRNTIPNKVLSEFILAYNAFMKWSMDRATVTINCPPLDADFMKLHDRVERTASMLLNVLPKLGADNDEIILSISNDEHQQLSSISTATSRINNALRKCSFIDQAQAQCCSDAHDLIRAFSVQLSLLQNLVSSQSCIAYNEEQVEVLIQPYVDICSDMIQAYVSQMDLGQLRNKKATELQNVLGENAWGKLCDESKTALITAVVCFSLYDGRDFDYSTICIGASKALEIELRKRFCVDYLAYLASKKTEYSDYPKPLLDRNGYPKTEERFTLGDISYILCPKYSDQCGHKYLYTYVRDRLIPSRSNEELRSKFSIYCEYIETIRCDYRNPSAHSGSMRRTDAERCLEIIISVEKILKIILDDCLY